jgi:hypothetical protein
LYLGHKHVRQRSFLISALYLGSFLASFCYSVSSPAWHRGVGRHVSVLLGLSLVVTTWLFLVTPTARDCPLEELCFRLC